METNHCVCVNNYMKVLKNLINSILSASGYQQGTIITATDSGYLTNNSNNFNANIQNSNSRGTDYLSSGFYIAMILIGLIMFMTGTRKEKKKSEFK